MRDDPHSQATTTQVHKAVTFSTVKAVKFPADPTILQCLSRHLLLPALASIEIQGTNSVSCAVVNTALRLLADFTNQPLPKLTSFRVSFFPYIKLGLFVNLLGQMPRLTTLGFRKCSIEILLGRLTADSQAPVLLVPKLSTVVLREVQIGRDPKSDSFCTALDQFYRSRTVPEKVEELQICTLKPIEVVDKVTREYLRLAGIPVVEGWE
jgi:hypothetical protein